MTAFAASTIRYQRTALTLMVTLSRVMVSCCSAETVRVRMSTRTERSTPSGMIQYKPGPRKPWSRPNLKPPPRSYCCATRNPDSAMTISAIKRMSRMGTGAPCFGASLRPFGDCGDCRYPRRLLDALPMQGDVQALAFLFLADAQTNGHVDGFQDEKTGHEAIGHRDRDAFELNPQRTVHAADFLADKHPGQQRADDAADAVHAERVERVVILQRMFERSRGEKAYDPGDEADDHRRSRPYESGRRRDGNQSRHGARGDP